MTVITLQNVTSALSLKNNMLNDVMRMQSMWCNRGKNTLLVDTMENFSEFERNWFNTSSTKSSK